MRALLGIDRGTGRSSMTARHAMYYFSASLTALHSPNSADTGRFALQRLRFVEFVSRTERWESVVHVWFSQCPHLTPVYTAVRDHRGGTIVCTSHEGKKVDRALFPDYNESCLYSKYRKAQYSTVFLKSLTRQDCVSTRADTSRYEVVDLERSYLPMPLYPTQVDALFRSPYGHTRVVLTMSRSGDGDQFRQSDYTYQRLVMLYLHGV